jgi:HK97 family phage portal protein
VGLVSYLHANLLERRGADPRSPWGDSSIPSNGMLAQPAAGIAVNEASVLGIAAAWACTTLLADSVATLTLRQYVDRGDTIKEIDPAPLIEQPFVEFDLQDWLTQTMMSRTVRGNVYGRIVDRDKNLYATQVMPVHPDQVQVRRDRETKQLKYKMNGEDVPLDDVFTICGPRMPGALRGLNPIEELRVSFGLARASDLYGASFFANSANPSGMLVSEEDLDPDEARALKNEWVATHGGIGQANLPAVITGGIKWEQISLTPEDSQFIQSRSFSRSEMAMIWRVPPHMIGDVDKTTSWGTGVEQQEIMFTRTTLAAYLLQYESALSKLLPPGQVVRFDLSDRLRGDTLQRYQAYALGRNWGWLSVNDILRAEGKPTIGPEGDVYLQPSNMLSLEDMGVPTGNKPAPNPTPASPSDVAPPGKAEQKNVIPFREVRADV